MIINGIDFTWIVYVFLSIISMGIGANLAHRKAKGKLLWLIEYDFSQPTKWPLRIVTK